MEMKVLDSLQMFAGGRAFVPPEWWGGRPSRMSTQETPLTGNLELRESDFGGSQGGRASPSRCRGRMWVSSLERPARKSFLYH